MEIEHGGLVRLGMRGLGGEQHGSKSEPHADTRAIFDAMNWPGYEKAHVLIMNMVLNEADVMPVEFTRLTAQTAKLLRKREKRLLATKAGQALARQDQAVELFRLLLATVFWRINLGHFDRVPIEA